LRTEDLKNYLHQILKESVTLTHHQQEFGSVGNEEDKAIFDTTESGFLR
jgi:hypothetical protein